MKAIEILTIQLVGNVRPDAQVAGNVLGLLIVAGVASLIMRAKTKKGGKK